MKAFRTVLALGMACALLITACGTASPPRTLDVVIAYPLESTRLTMGQALKCIVEVRDEGGQLVTDARVVLTYTDADGATAGTTEAQAGSGNVYRSDPWTLPHRSPAGAWTITARANTESAEGSASRTFAVENSLSEDLLGKYGFWVDDPTFRGIETNLVKEQGDAQDGAIIWGGVLPSQHIFPETWLEVRWRTGEFQLSSPAEVRSYMLDELGNLGLTPIRELEPFHAIRFKQWDAWQAQARGQYTRYDEQWVVFYSPEVDRTYAIGTTVVQAPSGTDPHAKMRDGFEVHPEVKAHGTAPAVLPHLLPPPTLVSPDLGSLFLGNDKPFLLAWHSTQDLAEDEYFQVKIDYNYDETNTSEYFGTRESELVLPSVLYDTPNCGVFNWQVTRMRPGSAAGDGEAISYNSLYWYLEWRHPPGAAPPFEPRCPNPQT
jgi:hypothetical protein